jgi:hypothetical protein
MNLRRTASVTIDSAAKPSTKPRAAKTIAPPQLVITVPSRLALCIAPRVRTVRKATIPRIPAYFFATIVYRVRGNGESKPAKTLGIRCFRLSTIAEVDIE